ncbi:hypothetical protein ABZ621_35745 [Streptomyces sp. NPDC007863]|uniref:hypothetical protein n=1 Tax=Streptomyces sp. NPDC007863 TaxID=3154894 RepID=UPI0033F864BA
MGNSGGAATHSGVDFQQRIAAYAMAHMLCGLEFAAFGRAPATEVTELRFETADEIDDLVVVGPDRRLFVQAKNTLSLSDAPGSEFGSVLAQFVAQYVSDDRPNDVYVLATSQGASGRIRKELRKVTDAARLNAAGGQSLPLTAPEQDVLTKTQDIIRSHYLARTRKDITELDLQRITARIHVSALDLAEGGSQESAILLVLGSRVTVPANLLWASMIAFGVSLARDRHALDVAAVQDRFGTYLGPSSQDQPTPAPGPITAELVADLPFGWDVVLAKSPYPECDFIVIDIMRFDEAGAKRHTFSAGQVLIGGREPWEVVGRWSTWAGCDRHMEAHADDYEDKRVAVLAADLPQDPNQSAAALAHAAHCARLAAAHEDPYACRHCGDPISEDGAPLVEIDEEGQLEDVGLVHHACLTPTDRVLGMVDAAIFRDHHRLRNFDYAGWLAALRGGQGMFGALAESQVKHGPILWKSAYDDFSLGKWCVRMILEDGGTTYTTDRGQVPRMSADRAAQEAEKMNRALAEAREKGDPLCYTPSKAEWGSYSRLLAQGHDPIPCTNAEVVPYTRAIGEAYSTCERYYTPLAYLVDAETGEPVAVEGVISLLTDPWNLSSFLKNWERAGIELPEFTVSALLTDEQFDRFVRLTMTRGQGVIVDPRLALDGSLVSGFWMTSFEQLLYEAEQDRATAEGAMPGES